MTDAPNWEGVQPRECGEHRTVGSHRAWCFDCTEWCYSRTLDMHCRGCELPGLRARLAEAEAELDRLAATPAKYRDDWLAMRRRAEAAETALAAVAAERDEWVAAAKVYANQRDALRDEIGNLTMHDAAVEWRKTEAKLARVEALCDEHDHAVVGHCWRAVEKIRAAIRQVPSDSEGRPQDEEGDRV